MPSAAKDPREIRRMFSSIAPRYDLLNRLLSLSLDRGWRDRAVRELHLPPGARVLDLCTGTGDLALALRRGGARVTGLDFAHEMLVRAGRKEPAVGWVEGDALRLPFRDARFDAVTIAFGLRNLADAPAGFREMRRVLHPGGRLAVLEFSLPPGRVFRGLYHLYLGRVVPAVGDRLGGRRGPYRYLARSIRAFPDQAALAVSLAAAGFQSVRWVNLARGIAALHLGERP